MTSSEFGAEGYDTPRPPRCDVHIAHLDLRVDVDLIRRAVDNVFGNEGCVLEDLGIILTDSATVRDLNRTWLGHDFETDVLSFTLDEAAASEGRVSGEIYVDLDTARERAPEFGATFAHEVVRYVIHGLLHLMGHVDEGDEERAAMRALEDRYLNEVFG